MKYRQLVALESPTEVRSATGAVSHEWTVEEASVAATISASVAERRGQDLVLVTDRYDIVLAGPHPDLRASWSVVDAAGARYDIEAFEHMVGGRQVRVVARLVTTPAAAPAGS